MFPIVCLPFLSQQTEKQEQGFANDDEFGAWFSNPAGEVVFACSYHSSVQDWAGGAYLGMVYDLGACFITVPVSNCFPHSLQQAQGAAAAAPAPA